jgi:fatty acid desaturase
MSHDSKTPYAELYTVEAEMIDDPVTIRKNQIVNSKGITYTQFTAALKPRYSIVWLNIGFGYAVLLAILLLGMYVEKAAPAYFIISIPLGAILVGYWFAFIHLFIHEASHYNIARDKKTNDLLANIFLGLIAGTDIKFYRALHFDHHRHLGTVDDPEHTYFDALNWRFVFESLTGIRLFKVIAGRNEHAKANKNVTDELMKKNKTIFLAGMLFNFLVGCAFFFTGFWQVALMWLAGIGVIFPFFLSLRQLLEHRSESAQSAIDYYKTDHGEVNRMFGVGLIALTFGSAGFNRHFLHHWAPQISCTRLGDLESYLKDTEFAKEVSSKRTSYFATFIKLFNK